MVTTGVVIVGIAVTAVAGLASYRSYRFAEVQQTTFKADNAASAAKLALDRVALSVRAVKAMYAADWVTPDQFVRFARTLMSSEGIRSLEFDRKVALADRAKYEMGLSSEEGGALGIWQYNRTGKAERAPDRPVYFVREATHNLGRAAAPLGFDVASVQPRAALINQSIASFDLAVSGSVAFGGSDGMGVVLVIPAIDRTGSIVGVATGTITFSELAAIAALASGARGVTVAVGVDKPGAAASPGENGGPVNPAFPNKRIFAFGGRTWTVAVPISAGGDPIAAWLVVLVIGAGLATTAAVVAYLVGLGKTADIAEARAQLLRMLDGLGPLAWLLAPEGTVVHANRTASAELRRPEDEIVGKPFWNLPLADAATPNASAKPSIGRRMARTPAST